MIPEERKQVLNIIENLTSALDSLLKDENGMDIGNNPFSEHAKLENTRNAFRSRPSQSKPFSSKPRFDDDLPF